MKKGLLLAGILAFTLSCKRDKLDFDLLKEIRLSPELSVPIIKTTLELGDLVTSDSILTVNPDNSLNITYFTDSLFGFQANQLVQIPDQAFPEAPLMVGSDLPPIDISLGTLANMKLSEAQFDQGYLRVGASADNPAPSDIEFKVTFLTAQDANGATLEKYFILPAGASEVIDSISLQPFTFDFDGPNNDLANNISFQAQITNAGNANNGDQFDVSMGFYGLSVGEVTGDFGNRNFNIPSGGFDFDISGLEEFANGFYLASPELKLIYRSNIGAGVQLKPNFNGMNKDQVITPLKLKDEFPLYANASSSSQVTRIDTLRIDANTSNVAEFLASLPQKILYSGTVDLNPNSSGSNQNFISKESKVSIGLEVNLPLEIRADNMTLEQNIDNLNISAENPDFIEELVLYFRTTTDFPFDIDLELTFMDSVDNVTLVQNLPITESPEVDPVTLKSVGKMVTDKDMTFTDSDIAALLGSDKLKIKAVLNTNNAETNDIVKLYTDYTLELRIAAQTKLNYQLSNED